MKKLSAMLVTGLFVIGMVGVANATSFVDSVISYSIGSPNDDPFATNSSIPNGITGAPDWHADLTGSAYYATYVNLGTSGEVKVSMDSWIEDGAGYDLTVYEIGASENVNVMVSSDLSNWIDLGLGFSSPGLVPSSTAWLYDFSGRVSTPIKYIMLTDANNDNSYHGADIDAIAGAYSTVSAVPEPATMLLLGTGLAGMIAARRRKKA